MSRICSEMEFDNHYSEEYCKALFDRANKSILDKLVSTIEEGKKYIIRRNMFVDEIPEKNLVRAETFIDVGELITCRDCRFCEKQTVRYSLKPIFVCLADWCMGSEGDNPIVKPNGFCAWSERRDDA